MKPYEETWVADENHPNIVNILDPATGEEIAELCESAVEEPPVFRLAEGGRARLAAQAPAMARLLLAGQWICEERGDMCRHCEKLESEGHAPDCELATVLRFAGVLS